MATPRRGEVWLIDFGQAGKTLPHWSSARSLAILIALSSPWWHTRPASAAHHLKLVRAAFLKPGAFLVQGVTTFPTVRALHRLGSLPAEAFDQLFRGLLRWLGHFREE